MNIPYLLSKTGAVLMFACMVAGNPALAQSLSQRPNVIFSTGFEPDEGYDPQFTLVDQNGWYGFGSGGNGLLTNFFEGYGQQAFLGFSPPLRRDDTLNVLRPLDVVPSKTNQALITFSVMMQIVDSQNGRYDDFRWSVYNTNGSRLFTLDFDNASLGISRVLDDKSGFVPTGLEFGHGGYYDLNVTMNFARNLWSATLNDFVIINSQPITTTGAALNLGDIDAVWAIQNPGFPGDNYMIFDNYRVVAENKASIPPRLELLGVLPNRSFGLRVYGEQGLNYVIDASTNLVAWDPIKVISAPAGGVFDYQDPDASRFRQRFYRVWQRP
jgi:hypothetical protein